MVDRVTKGVYSQKQGSCVCFNRRGTASEPTLSEGWLPVTRIGRVEDQIFIWVAFNCFILALLILDLTVFHRKAHVIALTEALLFSAFWIAIALLFNVALYFWMGSDKALEFLTGYLIEKFLSVDNMFVFVLIFSYFAVPAKHQHKVLFWGILGAVVMRGIFIVAGVALIQKFSWITYVFGAFLVATGLKMAFRTETEIRPEENPLIRLFRRFATCTDGYDEGEFFVKRNGRYCATTLFITLLFLNTVDLVFAVDSIPAVLAITHDTFIVYSSNVFAILGLRALYFALAGVIRLFHHLHYGLAAILVFVGIKMVLAEYYHVPIGIALAVICAILLIAVVYSLLYGKNGQIATKQLHRSTEQVNCRSIDPPGDEQQ
ncbi:MAG: TerC family protein [Desulfomonile tiedjei]|nr:TerC family protein [Desulfomonile tiedjei]